MFRTRQHRNRPNGTLRAAVFICWLLLACTTASAQDAGGSLWTGTVEAASASGEHFWLIIKDADLAEDSTPRKADEERPYQLCYHGPAMAAGMFAPLRALAALPEHFLAVGDHAFMISARDDPAAGFDVFSISVAHNEPFDVYYALPRDRMELHDPLPGGTIVDLADHGGSLVVLLDIPFDPNADASEESITAYGLQLMQLRTGGWFHFLMPPVQTGSDQLLRVATTGQAGDQLMLIEPMSSDAGQCVVHRLIGDESQQDKDSWKSETIALDLQSVRDITRSGGQAAIIQQTGSDTNIRLGYLRQTGVIELAVVDVPSPLWFIVGTSSKLQLITSSPDNPPTTVSIDAITGEQFEAQELRVHKSKSARIWFVALILAGSVSIALLIVLLRPAPKDAVELPKGVELLPPMQRLVSLVIDAFPAAVVTLLITRCSIAELLQAPLVTPKLIMSDAYLILIGLTLVHSTISEIATGTTLGKAMLGARVLTAAGEKPGIGACLLRAFGKLLTLLVLPIAVFGLLNRNYQGVDDLLGRTLVVHEPEEEKAASSDDR